MGPVVELVGLGDSSWQRYELQDMGKDPGLLLSVVFLCPSEGGEDGSLCWRCCVGFAVVTDGGTRLPIETVGLALRPPCLAFLTWWPVTHLSTRQSEDKVVA